MDLAPCQLVREGRPFGSLFSEDNWELFEQRDRKLDGVGASPRTLLAHGNNIIIGLDNGEIKIYSNADLQCKQVLAHSKLVSEVACLQSTSTEVIAGYRDAIICIWNIQSGDLVRRFCAGNRASDNGYAKFLHLKGTKLAVASMDGKVGIWKYENSSIKFLSGWKSLGSPMQVGIHGNHIILMEHSGFVGVYDFNGALVYKIGNPAEVRGVGIYEGYAIVGNKNCTVEIWDIKTGQRLVELEGHIGEVDYVSVHANYFLTSDSRGSVVVWSIEAALQGRPAAIVKLSDSRGSNWRSIFCQYSLGQNFLVRSTHGIIKVTDFL